jgi:3-dehydroquinate dehydratase
LKARINYLLSNINEQLNFIDLEIDNQIQRCEKAIEVIVKSKDNLRALVLKHNFKSREEEIHFFKEIKPQFLSKFIYYNAI